MKDSKKYIIIIIVLILVVLSLLAVYISIKDRNDNTNVNIGNSSSNNGNNNDNDNDIIDKDKINQNKQLLENEDLYFRIYLTLNDYYRNIHLGNKKEIYNVLEDGYKKDNNLTEDNVLNYIKADYSDSTYIIKEIYYNPNSRVTYYFTNGYLYNNSEDDESSYYDSVKFIVIIKNNHYVIKPLDNSVNYLNYVNNCVIEDININNSNILLNNTINEQNKLILYLNEFLNLLIYNPERAYNMLDANTLKKYTDYNNFYSERNNIFNKLSTNILSYNKSDNIYRIKDFKQNDIIITEERILDYKIGY